MSLFLKIQEQPPSNEFEILKELLNQSEKWLDKDEQVRKKIFAIIAEKAKEYSNKK